MIPLHSDRSPLAVPVAPPHRTFECSAVTEPLLQHLLRVARKILRCDDEAHDAVQEALISLWKQEELPPNPPAWLIQTVINRSLHARRCRERRRKHEDLAGTGRLAHGRADEDPAHGLECEDLRRKLQAAIGTLAEEYRTVFLLREVGGLDYESIARTVAVPIGTVRSRIHRARTQLQDRLAGEAGRLLA